MYEAATYSTNKVRYSSDILSKSRITKASKQKRSHRESERISASRRYVVEKQPIELGHGIINTGDDLPLVVFIVGPGKRLFSVHEFKVDAIPFFRSRLSNCFQYTNSAGKHVTHVEVPDDNADAFACMLEYLYYEDYTPYLRKEEDGTFKRLNDPTAASWDMTMYDPGTGMLLLRDTMIYCLALKYGLTTLQHKALTKQALRPPVGCATTLLSARYAYAHTDKHESHIRAHYLALIVRSRHAFKTSTAMEAEMVAGGRLFFDLFVAMCNHLDERFLSRAKPRSVRSGRTVRTVHTL